LSSIFNLVIRNIFKINKWLTIYYIAFYGILIGIRNTKPIIYKCIACNGVVVAGIAEVDAAIFVVADIVTSYCVIVGIGEADAVFVVADIVACNGVVAGIVEADAAIVVADIVACNGVVAGIVEADAAIVVVADIVA
jgi:hypothetical protein